jgi:hypothetical protein
LGRFCISRQLRVLIFRRNKPVLRIFLYRRYFVLEFPRKFDEKRPTYAVFQKLTLEIPRDYSTPILREVYYIAAKRRKMAAPPFR